MHLEALPRGHHRDVFQGKMKQDLQHGFAQEMRIKEQEKRFACTLVPHILNCGREKPGSKRVGKNKMM